MLGPEFEIIPWNVKDDAGLARVEAAITYGHPLLDGPLMDRMPKLKMISNHGVGVDHIDVAAAVARKIPVGNTPGCLDNSTADMTMALLLAAARNVVTGDRFAHSAEFTHYDPAFMIGQEVTGSVLGIIGLGRIGRQVAKRARAFDMRIMYFNRNRDAASEQTLGVEYMPFETVLSKSDFVTLNCPLTPETRGLMSHAQFDLMKPTGILINMARGPVVDPEALYAALSGGRIACAATDVTDPEPLPRDHKLLSLPNLIITPHLGSASNRTRHRMLEMTVANLRAGLRGEPLFWQVFKN